MAAQWSARAAVLRLDPDRGSQTRAGALERISASLLAEVPAAAAITPPAPAEAPRLAAAIVHDADYWRGHLAACQPYRCAKSGVMFNEGPIMDRLRARLLARIEGRPVAAIDVAPASTAAAAPIASFAPPPEVIPFTMGPQTDMFGLLG